MQRKSLMLGVILLAMASLGAGKCALVNAPPGPLPTLDPGHPLPTPTPTPEPPGPTPGGSVIPDDGAAMVSPRPPADPAIVAAINAAALRVAGCPEGPPSRCVVLRPMALVLAEVAAELRAQGITAGIQDHGAADEVCVGSATRCQGYHVFACGPTCDRGTVAWAPGSVRDTWTAGAAPGPEPTPTPPDSPGGCPAGTPGPGQYVVKCHVKPANPALVFCDATPKVVNREWCSAQSDNPNTQVVCPYGAEGSASREACERAMAWPVWEGAIPRDDNAFSADAQRGASVKVCARDFPAACGETAP